MFFLFYTMAIVALLFYLFEYEAGHRDALRKSKKKVK